MAMVTVHIALSPPACTYHNYDAQRVSVTLLGRERDMQGN